MALEESARDFCLLLKSYTIIHFIKCMHKYDFNNND